MKKLSILFLSLIALGTTVVSCSKDDDSAKPVSLLGTWKYKKVEIKIEGESIVSEDFTTGCAAQGKLDNMTLKADNKYDEIGYDSENNCAEVKNQGEYILSPDGKTLTMDAEMSFRIVKLTANEMELHGIFPEQEGVSAELIMAFKR